MGLRWEQVGSDEDHLRGWSGLALVAICGRYNRGVRPKGRPQYFWRVYGIDIRPQPQAGDVGSLAAARDAADRAWAAWLETAGLRPAISPKA